MSDVVLLPDGAFTFSGVPPGRYEIRARAQLDPGGVTHVATFYLRIDRLDVDNVVMPLRPAGIISGTVQPAPAARRRSGGLRVRAALLANDTSSADVTTTDVQPNGAFVLDGLMAGTHLLQVDGLPQGWLLKSVVFRGEDVTDAGLEASPGQRLANVTLTVTDAALDVSGRVSDADGRPAAGAVVLIIPLSEQFWHRTSRRLAVLTTDAAGRFTVRGLPDGEYRAAACLAADGADPYRPDVLRRFSASGVPLTLRGTGSRVVNLTLIPAASGGAAPQ